MDNKKDMDFRLSRLRLFFTFCFHFQAFGNDAHFRYPRREKATKRMRYARPDSHVCYYRLGPQGPHTTRPLGYRVAAVQSAQVTTDVPLDRFHPPAYVHNGRNRRLVFFLHIFTCRLQRYMATSAR